MNRGRTTGYGLAVVAFCLASHWCAAEQSAPQRWAVVIGINDYEDKGLEDLSEAVHDAQAVYDLLIGLPEGFPEENTTLLIDGEGKEKAPTRSNLIRYLTSALRLPAADDTILLYFAGHGMTKDGALYLLPSDAASINIEQTGLAFAEVQRLLDECKAKKKVMILDACHSGTGRGEDTMDEDFVRELEKASSGKVLLASCTANERSYEMPKTGHGAFTYFLLEGMKGAADTDRDGYITATELSIYTFEKTRRWAQQEGLSQTPMRKTEVSGEIALGRYVVDKLKPPEAIALTGYLQVNVNVRDAVVEVGGVEKGTVAPDKPLELKDLPEGPVRVTVSAPGYARQDQEATIERGQWEQLTFVLEVESSPEGQAGEVRSFDGIEFVWIPAGTFMMGSGLGPSQTEDLYGGDAERYRDEGPQHGVTLSKGFWMGKFEVTQAQWQAVAGTNPSKFKAADCPVERVSWKEVQDFLARLNERTSGGYRLPTEAEWEYACRAETTTVFSYGDDPARLGQAAWFADNSAGETHPVGKNDANPWGLHDMHGNVWEWCQDGKEEYPAGAVTDPVGATSGSVRVKRGGGWSDTPGNCRAAARGAGFADEGEADLGFRLVRQ